MPTTSSSSVGLVRQLGIVSATALVISNMIGTGIFGTTGFLAGQLGTPGLVLGIWLVGAVCALVGSFCYSELGINYPSSGGEYVYLTRAYGPTWGFMTGWTSFFAGFSAPIAAAALAFSDYLGYFSPAIKQANAQITIGSGAYAFKFGGAQAVACALIALFTVINCLGGVQKVARIQNALTGTKVIVLLIFILLALLVGRGSWGNFSLDAARTTSTPIFSQFAVSLFWIYVSYSGWNAATYVAEELKNPARTLPVSLTIGTVLVATLYIALNVIFIYGAPLEVMKGEIAIGSLTAYRLFGREIGGAFSLLMALGLMSTVSAMVTIGPRLYYAMAKNGAFFQVAARIDERTNTPVIAIICQGVCAMLMTFTPFPDLMTYIGVTLNFFACMSVASLFIFRRRPEWQRLPAVSFAWPLVPGIFILVGIWMTVYGFTLQPLVSLCALITIGGGALVYHIRVKSHDRTSSATAPGRV